MKSRNTRNIARGNLILSSNPHILFIKDNQFGLLHQVSNTNEPVYLYAKPPTKKIHQQVKKPSTLTYQLNAKEAYPVIVMNKHHIPMIGINQQLQPNQEVMARNVPGHADIKEVVVFTRSGIKRDDMKESGRGIHIVAIGFAFKNQLKEHTHTQEGFTRPSTEPIFPNHHLVDDIRQSIFGDCFLLSSLITILNQPGGEEFIRGMMVQRGTTVVVRLFNPNTKQPIYIEVENSLYKENEKITVEHRARWVHILEKAYTSLAFKEEENIGEENKYAYSDLSFRAVFGEGGDAHLAMKILTGEEAKKISIQDSSRYPWDSGNISYCQNFYGKTKPLIDVIDSNNLTDIDTLQFNIEKIFLKEDGETFLKELINDLRFYNESVDDEENYKLIIKKLTDKSNQEQSPYKKELIEYIQELFNQIKRQNNQSALIIFTSLSFFIAEIIQQHQDHSPKSLFNALDQRIYLLIKMGAYLEKLMSGDLEENNSHIQEPRFKKFLNDFIFNQATDNSQIMAKLHLIRNEYTDFPREIINCFEKLINNKNNSSIKSYWNDSAGSGIYNQETLDIYDDIRDKINNNHLLVASTLADFNHRIPGLRPSHAYGMIDVVEENKIKYVIVRNPWGRVGRVNNFNQKQVICNQSIQEVESAVEFRVELSEFVTYFSHYTISEEKFKPPLEFFTNGKHLPKQLNSEITTPIKPSNLQASPMNTVNPPTTIYSAAAGSAVGANVGAVVGVSLVILGLGPSVGLSALFAPLIIPITTITGATVGALGCMATHWLVKTIHHLFKSKQAQMKNSQNPAAAKQSLLVKQANQKKQPTHMSNVQHSLVINSDDEPEFVPGPFCQQKGSRLSLAPSGLFNHHRRQSPEECTNQVKQNNRRYK